MKPSENTVRRTGDGARSTARAWLKWPGATSCTAIAGSVVALKTESHSSCFSGDQSACGGVTWKNEGASSSHGAAGAIIAIAQRRDSGDGATTQTPSLYGTSSCSAVQRMTSCVKVVEAARTPSASGWSRTSSGTSCEATAPDRYRTQAS